MNEKLEAALAYSRMHWRIFPCHSVVMSDTGPCCSCGRANCTSPAKHPRTKAGFKEATDDIAQIKRWWNRWPQANIGLATGGGLAIFDIDGQEGLNEFQAFIANNGRVPETLSAQTGRGYHLVFATRDGAPSVRSSAVGKVHVRGEGGYIIVPPSNHISGRNYQWIKKVPLAILPDSLRQWSQGYEVTNKTAGRNGFDHLGPAPAYLSESSKDISSLATEALKTVYSPSEEMRLKSALSAVPADRYDSWFQVGMALKDLGWERSDGTDIGFEVWTGWSETCPEKFSVAACEAKWNSFKRAGVTLGTVYHLAQQHGWNGGAPAPLGSPVVSDHGPGLNGIANGFQALPAAFQGQQPIFFPDLDEKRRPRPTCTNAGVAVQSLAIVCEKDQFHEKLLTGGHVIEQWAGDLSDEVVQMLRKTIRARFGFDPGEKNVRDACVQLALENQFDPVLDYLEGVTWDGNQRLNSWLVRYMGTPDTELNRVIGRLVLIAAVRRQRAPGTKFDQIVVLESKEGFGKSTAIEILAGKENFSDQSILNKQEREQQEAMCGVWLYEIADLTGMRKADIEHIKAFASRTSDRARPAYGRFRVDRPRRTIFFATTNDDEYLKSQTGNRRFWPISVSIIDLMGLRRDRDQLWAEAVTCEARGDSIALPERLWGAAGDEQDQRTEIDPWHVDIANYIALKGLEEVSTRDVLVDNQFLRIEPSRIGRWEQMRAGNILRALGFERYKKRIGNHTENRYVKKHPEV